MRGRKNVGTEIIFHVCELTKVSKFGSRMVLKIEIQHRTKSRFKKK